MEVAFFLVFSAPTEASDDIGRLPVGLPLYSPAGMAGLAGETCFVRRASDAGILDCDGKWADDQARSKQAAPRRVRIASARDGERSEADREATLAVQLDDQIWFHWRWLVGTPLTSLRRCERVLPLVPERLPFLSDLDSLLEVGEAAFPTIWDEA